MSVLSRIVAALLIAVPAFLVLVIVFALAGRRRTYLPLESQIQPGSRKFRCASRFLLDNCPERTHRAAGLLPTSYSGSPIPGWPAAEAHGDSRSAAPHPS